MRHTDLFMLTRRRCHRRGASEVLTLVVGLGIAALAFAGVLWYMFAVNKVQGSKEYELLFLTIEGDRGCREMRDVVYRLQGAGFNIREVDRTKDEAGHRQYKANILPTFVLLENGKEIGRKVGMTDEAGLRELLAPAMTQ